MRFIYGFNWPTVPRVYALNAWNKMLLGFFALLTVAQLTTGILLVAVPSNSGELSYPHNEG